MAVLDVAECSLRCKECCINAKLGDWAVFVPVASYNFIVSSLFVDAIDVDKDLSVFHFAPTEESRVSFRRHGHTET